MLADELFVAHTLPARERDTKQPYSKIRVFILGADVSRKLVR